MTRPKLELADIFREHGEDYRSRHSLSPQQSKVLNRIVSCRTAALGGHQDTCSSCDFQRLSYNSCRDRHCPKCQASKQASWLETRLERLLPVPYFHVVFTLPHVLNPLVMQNAEALYNLLFAAASATLLTLAANPRWLGAQIGITAVLHTWSQNLLLHPHLHCVVTGGGLSFDGQRWIEGRRGFLFPVKVVAAMFRGKFLAGLKKLWESDQLKLNGSVSDLKDAGCFRRFLSTLYDAKWVVYAKRPFGGPEQVFSYLGRYTHRVAITNSRLVMLENGHVSLEWKDYADESRKKVMRLPAEEFVRRFLLHVLPKGFVRIRHYGLMASGNVSGKLAQARKVLDAKPVLETASSSESKPAWLEGILARLQAFRESQEKERYCPRCGGELIRKALEGRKLSKGPPECSSVNDEASEEPASACDSS
jgi:hypothetical protein